MRAILVSLVVLISAVGLGLMVSTPVAQTTAADEEAAGKLYFNATQMKEDDDCFTYGLEAIVPNATAAKKAYTGPSDGFDACDTIFEYNTTTFMQLSGKARVHFFLACDSTRPVMRVLDDTAAIAIMKDGKVIDRDTYESSGPTCGTTPVEITSSLDTKNTTFNETELFQVRIQFFVFSPDDQTNPHVLVGSKTRNSSVQAMGLPIPFDPNATASPTSETGATTGTGGTGTGGTGNATATGTGTRTARPTMTGTAGTGTGTTDVGGDEDDGGPYDTDASETKEVSGEGSPGPGLLLAVAAVMAAGIAVQRRRRQ